MYVNGPFTFLGGGGLDVPDWPGQTSWSWSTVFYPGQLSIEFANIDGWLTSGDLALDSCAQFLAVAEHMLIPSRSVSHQLRKAGHQSVWAPACQDRIAGNAGVGVVSLGGASLSLPSFVTPQFKESCRLGRVCEPLFPLIKEEWFICLWSMVVRGLRRMLKSCSLLIGFFKLSLLRLRWFVLVSPC